jgi:hypothetical protein
MVYFSIIISEALFQLVPTHISHNWDHDSIEIKEKLILPKTCFKFCAVYPTNARILTNNITNT